MTPIIQIKSSIQKSFSAIGKKNGTSPPKSTRNTFSVAYEFFVAGVLRSMSNKRYDEAKKSALDAGLFGDPNTYSVGGIVTVSSNEHFDITAKTSASSDMLDKTMLSNELTKRYGDKIAVEIITASSKPKKGAVTIDCAMKIEG